MRKTSFIKPSQKELRTRLTPLQYRVTQQNGTEPPFENEGSKQRLARGQRHGEMEALRISIGLEAYAQRDPLVQYKNRAFELFQNLLSDMRMGVVTRMFTYRPRDLSSVQASTSRGGEAIEESENGSEDLDSVEAPEEEVEESQLQPVSEASGNQAQQQKGSTSKKRRRRRR